MYEAALGPNPSFGFPGLRWECLGLFILIQRLGIPDGLDLMKKDRIRFFLLSIFFSFSLHFLFIFSFDFSFDFRLCPCVVTSAGIRIALE
jgi:hypothetical protein